MSIQDFRLGPGYRPIVPLRRTPPLTDVAGCLRFLAEEVAADKASTGAWV